MKGELRLLTQVIALQIVVTRSRYFHSESESVTSTYTKFLEVT